MLLQQAEDIHAQKIPALAAISQLRKTAAAAQAAVAYEMALLRARATEKFTRANHMYFVREALEQATSERVAQHRAQRFAGFHRIGDFCCSIGGDTIALALAQHADVIAIDQDPLRLAMAAENATAYRVRQRVQFDEADVGQTQPNAWGLQAIFFDPARRAGGQRKFALADYTPPVTLVQPWLEQVQMVGVKISPGVSDADVAQFPQAEVEFISVDGELKEAVLWFGAAAQAGRTATVLNNQAPCVTRRANTSSAARLSSRGFVSPPQAFLYEPDPAIIRAHLVVPLAQEIGAAQMDEHIAYLTAGHLTKTPLARCWRVLDALPFQLKHLRARLRMLHAGAVTVKKRGSPVDTDALARQLSNHAGERELVVVLTPVRGQPYAIICEGPI